MAVKDKKPKGKSHIKHADMQRIVQGGGGDPIQVYAQASPRQRAILKHRAAKQGTTIAGYIQGGPLALREHSPSGLRNEANRRIGSAYAPAEGELSDREKRITNLDAARKQDEEAYANWATTTQNQLAAAAKAATDHLEQTLKDLTTEAQGLQSDVSPQVAAQMGPEHQHSVESVLNQRIAAARDSAQSTENSNFLQGNVIASGQARAASRARDTSSALADVATDRKTLSANRRADVVKEIARLADREITTAQGNRDFEAALSKLGIDRAKLGADIADDKADNKAKRRDQRLAEIAQRLKAKTLDETTRHHLETEQAALLNANNKGDSKGTNKFGVTNKEASTNRSTFQNMVYRLRFGSLSKQSANAHPLLARAAAAWLKHTPLDSHTIRGIQKIYGFTPPVRKAPKRLPKSGDHSPGQSGPGAGTR